MRRRSEQRRHFDAAEESAEERENGLGVDLRGRERRARHSAAATRVLARGDEEGEGRLPRIRRSRVVVLARSRAGRQHHQNRKLGRQNRFQGGEWSLKISDHCLFER